MPSAPLFVGIDVAKDRLEVAIRPSGEQWSATNDADGLTALVTRLHDLQPTLVVLEASGGYERPLMRRWPLLACPWPWYFRDIPSRVPTTGCVTHRGLTLLYVGIAPRAPRGNGSGPSRQTLRDRIKMHMRGPAEGSTLRISLGCLLAEDLGLQLRRVGGGRRTTFTAAGERALSAWMERNAFVTWLVSATPWTVEEELIRGLSLPLNLHHNRHHPFRPVLSALRSAAKAEAQALPIVQEG